MKIKLILLLGGLLLLSGCDNKIKKEVDNIKSTMATKSDVSNLQAQIDEINEKMKTINQNKSIVIKYESNSSLISEVNNLKEDIKEINSSLAFIPKNVFHCKGHFKPTTFITTKKAKIYNSKGKVVDVWPKCTTFTSYVEKNSKFRITGIFVNYKWQNALSKDWWIDVKDVAKKFKDKNESKNMRNNQL